MDVERAVTLLRNHLVWRKKWDIDNIDLATVKAYLDMSFFAFDPTARDKDGRGVAYLFPAHFHASLLADTKVRAAFYTAQAPVLTLRSATSTSPGGSA